MDVRALAAWAEHGARVGDGPGERYAGWALVGLPFESGHVLALRRFPASSVGPAYTSVWHRDPDRRWTMYVDAPADVSCPRYFGRALDRIVETDIVIAWTGPRRFRVVTGTAGFGWQVRLRTTPITRLMSAFMPRLPAAWLCRRWLLGPLGRLAGPLLDAGRFRLHGRVPGPYAFRLCPTRLWAVADSSAVVLGADVGAPRPLHRQARLADFWIPQRGLLGFGETIFEPHTSAKPDSARAA